MLKRALLLAAVVLALGAAGAQASPLLTTHDAKNSMRHWSLNHGMERVEVRKCWRLSRDRIRCVMAEWGRWGEGELRAEGALSKYEARRTPQRVVSVWIDLAFGSLP